MSFFVKKPATADYYTWLLREFGPQSPLALGWHNRESQQLRFEIFARHLNLAGKTVLDIGCGLADFYAYLASRGISCHYIGVDITPSMVEVARQRYPGIDIRLEDAMDTGFSISADIVVFSGTFNYRVPSHDAFLKRVITRLWGFSREALAFNVLSAITPHNTKDPHLAYIQPSRILTLAQQFTPFVRLDHSYLIHDFTTVMYRHLPA